MIIELAISGACAAGGIIWAVKVVKDEGWRLLNPMVGWDKKLDVFLGFLTAGISLVCGPVKGIMMTFLSISFSVMIRLREWLGFQNASAKA